MTQTPRIHRVTATPSELLRKEQRHSWRARDAHALRQQAEQARSADDLRAVVIEITRALAELQHLLEGGR